MLLYVCVHICMMLVLSLVMILMLTFVVVVTGTHVCLFDDECGLWFNCVCLVSELTLLCGLMLVGLLCVCVGVGVVFGVCCVA